MISSVSMSSLSVSVSQVSAGGSSQASAAAGSCNCGSTGDRADISGPGKMFAELKQLASQDPAKFKQVAADIASKLKAAAGGTVSSSGNDGSTTAAGNKFLTDLAAKFDTAAQTGDVSGLQPHGGRHHHHHATGGSQETGMYNQQGQTPAAAPAGGADLKALFDGISKEVTDSLTSTAAA